MITCDRCGRVNGRGAKGDSWICGDCRMKPIPESHEEREQSESSAEHSITRDSRPGP
ncbi:hypothetical protein O9H85_20690 [Paenibacillus filicis]|uniref:Uncharacterized protein n=1 Tax=Paenibacillus gyeongsangnamensis TaxID=3388067 RepID=A0ABT4QD30_9BACL|nr:hypothetical protein [Paenibacillus filicis]MCZ8514793.1 hypothetical protein [Paenibacillus filicis]